jgi:large subunit ribosomal protein L29
MRIDEIKGLGDQELAKELDESYREMMNLRFRVATRQLQNVHEPGEIKKRIARIKTVQRQRELGFRE